MPSFNAQNGSWSDTNRSLIAAVTVVRVMCMALMRTMRAAAFDLCRCGLMTVVSIVSIF